MGDKTGMEVFLEYAPAFTVWYKIIGVYTLQFILFILIMAFFWRISSTEIYYIILAQIIISFLGTCPYRYMATSIEKIRDKYRKKYGKLAGQSLWFHYQSYTIPLLSSSMYFPILLYTYKDLTIPQIIQLPSHFITNSLLPFYIAIPLGIIVVILGILIRRPSGGFDADIDTYLYLMFPENGRLVSGGMYQYIRNPRYLSRGFMAVGLGIVANNILAIIVGFIHFLAFCSLILTEDKELIRRFGDDFKEYRKRVPALFPKFGNWRKFFRFIFVGEKQ